MRIGRYSEIESGHQPRVFFAPEAGKQRMTLGKRIARWFRLTFGQLPRGRDRVEPGLPPELIGTGYKATYYPPNRKSPPDGADQTGMCRKTAEITAENSVAEKPKKIKRCIMYYRICERCGAHLDPGETCDCQWMDWPERELCQGRRKPCIGGYELDSYAKEGRLYEYPYA